VDGKIYHSLEDLPPELRQSVDGAFQMLSDMGILQSMPEAQTPPINREPQFESKPFVPQGSPVIEEERGGNTFTLILGGMILCSALAAIAMAVYYLSGR
jgi:hypothetical protein